MSNEAAEAASQSDDNGISGNSPARATLVGCAAGAENGAGSAAAHLSRSGGAIRPEWMC